MISQLDDWKSGPTIPQGDHLQQMVAALRTLDEQEGFDNRRQADWYLYRQFPAYILASLGGRFGLYTVRAACLAPGLSDQGVAFVSDALDTVGVYTATNLAEYGATTNSLPQNQPVWVWAWHDRGDSPRNHFFFNMTPPTTPGSVAISNYCAALDRSGEIPNIAHLSLQSDDFLISQPISDATEADIEWTGVDIVTETYVGVATNAPKQKIIRFKPGISPVAGTDYPISFTVSEDTALRPGATCASHQVNRSTILAKVTIPTGGVTSDISELAITTDGGANASTPTAAATYTYAWTDPDGGAHAGTSPLWQRPVGVLTGPGSRGMIRKISGTWTLLFTDEQPAVALCSGETG